MEELPGLTVRIVEAKGELDVDGGHAELCAMEEAGDAVVDDCWSAK